jgi:transposase
MEVVVDRCAGLDVHKDTVMACVRVPGSGGARFQQVREFRTFTGALRALRKWLIEQGVTEVAMEATGVYWKPVWHVLAEQPGPRLLLVNAAHVKNVPGRKTDVNDAAWLAQLCECGLLRGSFVPEPVIGQLRDLTRYRKKLIEDRARETQRIQKLLEDAGIKLGSVVSDVLGVSGRQMLDALLTGADDPTVLAEFAHGRMRTKIPLLRQALEGRFGVHHAVLLRLHLRHVDDLTGMVDSLDGEIDRVMAPFTEHLTRLQTIPGVGKRTAEVIIAEIGVDMTRFPTAGHLASWAGMCPGNHESAHKRKSGHARKGDAALRTALCEAAWCASRTHGTYLAAQHRQFLRRFGKKAAPKAAFAVGHTILVITWHLLSRGCDYQELGGNYLDHRNDRHTRQRYLIRQLEALGNKVTIEPAA